ncbi:MAG: DUF1343 domain-containing protein [Prolixibacteraceae bacterium]|nr:DUF1343 domain-containing protein [Prolixibacteraceae bacterium]
MFRICRYIGFLFLLFSCKGGDSQILLTGAGQPEKYLPLLAGKKTGLVVNHSSLYGEKHLVDFLLENNIEVSKIFAPEHGFRGDAAAGEIIKDGVDGQTGIPVTSLYGNNRKPLPGHLSGIDIMVFDIQDVGCRFYTYISTLHLVMEACAEAGITLVVLDRPNPNGDYVAGPVLEPGFESFVGMHPVPVVHGCTIGELAQMINGEHWLNSPERCKLIVISAENYTHNMNYSLPVRPSPNLPNDLAVRLYPSLCFFEATSVSVGRGTKFPFQVLGAPVAGLGDFKFTPVSIPGVAVNPLNEGEVCYGIDLRTLDEVPEFTLKFFLDFYNKFENEKDFLIRERWFNLLAGTDRLIEQIRKGYSEEEILNSWQPDIERYKSIRKKYLLYPDFE